MEAGSIKKLSISGTTLSSLLQRSSSSSSSNGEGLLLGHVSVLPPPEPTDDEPSPSPSPSNSAFISNSFFFDRPAQFYDSVGKVDSNSLQRLENCSIMGWFSARRSSSLRPSMREYSVSVSLSEYTQISVFLLISSSTGVQSTHTHDFRAYALERDEEWYRFSPISVEIVNLGPASRAGYNLFLPESSFPRVPFGLEEDKSLRNLKLVSRDSALLAKYAEGFELERLRRMVGDTAEKGKIEVEKLYDSMLVKLEGLAKLVEKSSDEILEQEEQNRKLKSRLGETTP